MKISIYILVLCVGLLSCEEDTKTMAKQERLGYTINAKADTNTGYAYLQKYDADNVMASIDSVSLENYVYTFKGHVNNLEPYQVVADEHVYPIILENTTYTLKEEAFTGTKLQDDYVAYYEGLLKTDNAFVYQRNFINSHPENMLAVIVLKTMLGKTKWRINQNKLAFEALEHSIKQSHLGREIKTFIDTQEALLKENKDIAGVKIPKEKKPSAIPNEKPVEQSFVKPKVITKTKKAKKNTKKAPKPAVYTGVNFQADDINGNNFELSKITTKSKYVLIDFWASWCAPCRKQNPYLVEVYNMYHDKGFDIVSVTQDRSKLAWQKAVATDGLEWHQVIDDFNRLTKLYNIESIPHTILINSNGEIIASDISPYILKTKLAGLLRK